MVKEGAGEGSAASAGVSCNEARAASLLARFRFELGLREDIEDEPQVRTMKGTKFE